MRKAKLKLKSLTIRTLSPVHLGSVIGAEPPSNPTTTGSASYVYNCTSALNSADATCAPSAIYVCGP